MDRRTFSPSYSVLPSTIVTASLVVVGVLSLRNITVNIGAILPNNSLYPYSIQKIEPVFHIALRTVKRRILTRAEIRFTYVDSGCSIAQGPNAAFQLYTENSKIAGFFGPVCDYALAPVSRQAKYWNLPVVTVGGTASQFTTLKPMYPTLTRVGYLNFVRLAKSLFVVMKTFGWSKFLIVYTRGYNWHSRRMCHLTSEAIIDGSKHEPIFVSYTKVESDTNITELIAQKIGNEFAANHLLLSAA